MSIRITDPCGIPIKGCATFDYKGYVVSLTTMDTIAEVMVLDKSGTTIPAIDVREAIWIIESLPSLVTN